VCTLYMCLILRSAIARAQSLYKVRLCAALFMGNHLHFLLIVDCPESAMRFMDRIKTETAHAVNRLLGRRKRTVWCDDYDALPVLTLDDAIEKFIYLYTNPAQANLIESISSYPGFSTWRMLFTRETTETVPWIQRPMIEPLSSPALSRKQDLALTAHLTEVAQENSTLVLSPDDWLECFGVSQHETERYRWKILEGVRQKEEELTRNRQYKVLGEEALRRQPINKPFSPKKFSRRMWCICCDVAERKKFIAKYKALRAQARDVYQRWRKRDFSVPYPPELFAPRVPMLLVT